MKITSLVKAFTNGLPKDVFGGDANKQDNFLLTENYIAPDLSVFFFFLLGDYVRIILWCFARAENEVFILEFLARF